ncbi:unnamed protein product, partial [Vitis vinifera]|uniref:Uncharacterized protein n=1 Tax=Vitis vinifera TaxID=29760 RepID=D7TWT3_VITVI
MSMIMEALKTLLSAPLLHFIHKDFHRALANMTLIDRFFFLLDFLCCTCIMFYTFY